MTDPSYRKLYAAILFRAIADLTPPERDPSLPGAKSKINTDERHARSARAWIMAGGSWFRTVCDVVGFDADDVRAKVARDDFTSMPRRGKHAEAAE